LLWAAHWWTEGRTTIAWNPHLYAYTLMASRIGPSVLEGLKFPARSVLVSLPAGLRSVDTLTRLVIFTHDAGTLSWLARGEIGVELWRRGLTVASLGEKDNSEGRFAERLDDQDARVMLVIDRLVAGLLLSLNDPQRVRRKSAKSARKKKGFGAALLDATFVVGAPVTVNAREGVEAYIRGDDGRQKGFRSHAQRYHTKEGVVSRWKEPFWNPSDLSLPVVGSDRKGD
jgi:hypothetical protein